MNEQFEKLLLKAQKLAREQVKSSPEFAKYAPSYAIPGTEIHVGLRLSYEKFAELIVQECARVARATPCPYEEDEVRQRLGHTWDMASVEAGREIVKHFGVEK